MELYGVRSWGSAIAEAMLVFAGRPYTFVDVTGFDTDGPARDRLLTVNPLAQVPALVLDDGTVMTETAAIALWLADGPDGPNGPLAPPPGSAERARFLRLLVWLVANVYPTFTYADYPARWTASAPNELVESTRAYRESLYRWLEDQAGAPFLLGETLSALDLYLAVMIDWEPRRPWFESQAPKLTAIALQTRQVPALQAVYAANARTPPTP